MRSRHVGTLKPRPASALALLSCPPVRERFGHCPNFPTIWDAQPIWHRTSRAFSRVQSLTRFVSKTPVPDL